MEFEQDVEVKGIPGYRFTPPRSVLASVEENPDNAGFCQKPELCLGSGVLKVDVCRKGGLSRDLRNEKSIKNHCTVCMHLNLYEVLEFELLCSFATLSPDM